MIHPTSCSISIGQMNIEDALSNQYFLTAALSGIVSYFFSKWNPNHQLAAHILLNYSAKSQLKDILGYFCCLLTVWSVVGLHLLIYTYRTMLWPGYCFCLPELHLSMESLTVDWLSWRAVLVVAVGLVRLTAEKSWQWQSWGWCIRTCWSLHWGDQRP